MINKNWRIYFATVTILISLFTGTLSAFSEETTDQKNALEGRIKNKSEELESLNRELAAKQAALQGATSERVSLEKELTNLEKNIAYLKLSIKNDELTAEKLTDEIGVISYDIKDIEQSIICKQESMGGLIESLNEHEMKNPLMILLEYKSLGDAISEINALSSIKNQIREDMNNLASLKNNLEGKLDEVTTKKTEIDSRKQAQLVKKIIVEDQKEERKQILTETQNKENLYAKQVDDLEKQQNALEDEIETYELELRAKFNPSQTPTVRGGMFAWPITLIANGGKGTITQHYGEKSYLYRGKPHNGLDIGAPVGTPVYAAYEGVVTAVDNNDVSAWRKYQYGKYILVKHPNNITTIYAHLSQSVIGVGNIVKRGDLIGYSGNTGYTTGPHLHFGAYYSASVELKSIPPAAGLVPVGVTLRPEDYL